MTDFLAEKRAEIDNRLKELRPLYEEYLVLERAKAALENVNATGGGAGRTRGAAAGARRRGRRRGSGTRAQEALEVVRQNPGITVAEIARQLGVNPPNYMYRVLATLESEGAVRKEGRGYTAV
ncbi:MAG: helix-turn-helix domain-containing protein [Thermoleophilaceae bacterium]|nr:helix-turn-helix domain-containing protein [Thermoleophilaceae bacterium]